MKRLLAGLATAMAITPCIAHDLWLWPEPLEATMGSPLNLRLVLGEDGEIEKMLFDPQRVERLWRVSSRGTQPMELPAPRAAIEVSPAPGTTAFGYVSRPALSELPPDRFEAYLREEHLEGVLTGHQPAEPLSDGMLAAVREHYSRSLKALVVADGDALTDCPLGLPLELSLLGASPAGLVVQATLRDEPAAALWVELADKQGRVLEARATDEDGQATFSLPKGASVLRTTHIEPAHSSDADWRSWWATTTFALGDAGITGCESRGSETVAR